MKKFIPTMFCTVALMAAAATPALASVNCGLINKNLDRGKKAEDVAEQMGVSVADVQQCKASPDKATTGPANAGAAPNTAPKGAKPPMVPNQAQGQ